MTNRLAAARAEHDAAASAHRRVLERRERLLSRLFCSLVTLLAVGCVVAVVVLTLSCLHKLK